MSDSMGRRRILRPLDDLLPLSFYLEAAIAWLPLFAFARGRRRKIPESYDQRLSLGLAPSLPPPLQREREKE